MRKLIVVLFIFILGCSGEKKLPLASNDGPQLYEKTLYAEPSDHAFYTTKFNTGSSPELLLGAVSDEYKTRILLLFTSLPDSVDRVESAKITLYSWNVLGDTLSAPFQANMYKLTSAWTETAILDWNEVTGDNVLLGSAEIFPEVSDSFEFTLPAGLVESWIDTTRGEDNYGVYIEPVNATFIIDFYSRETLITQSPFLEIIYELDGELDTINVLCNRDVFIIEENLSLDDDHLYIGKGVAARSLLRFDVLSQIDSTATINRAELILKINRERSLFNARGVEDLVAMRAANEADDIQDVIIDSTLSGYTGSVLKDTVTVDITGLCQQWSVNNKLYENYGLILKSEGESVTLSRTAFYGSGADSSLIPSLLVRYTLPPRESIY